MPRGDGESVPKAWAGLERDWRRAMLLRMVRGRMLRIGPDFRCGPLVAGALQMTAKSPLRLFFHQIGS